MGQAHEAVPQLGDDQTSVAQICVGKCTYDFAVDGGGVGTINLMANAVLGIGTVVLAAFIKVITPPTSGGAATISLGTEAAGDLIAATAYNAAPFSTAGRKALTKTFATNPIEMTVARNIAMAIATAALTGGKFEVTFFYLPAGY